MKAAQLCGSCNGHSGKLRTSQKKLTVETSTRFEAYLNNREKQRWAFRKSVEHPIPILAIRGFSVAILERAFASFLTAQIWRIIVPVYYLGYPGLFRSELRWCI